MSEKISLINDNWTKDNYSAFVEYLKGFADGKYRDFHSSLVPTQDKRCFLGVRMPKLREIGKEISKGNSRGFLDVCGGEIYEERVIRGIVTGLIKPVDYGDFTSLCDSFLPFVNSWAVCDCFCAGLKYTKKYKHEFFGHIGKYLRGNEWDIRVALVLMLNYYLEDEYIDDVLKRTDGVKSGDYYVQMAQAWLVATALAKLPEKTMEYIKSCSLDDFTFNKAVQKSIESRRIDDKTKEYLKTIKRKRA